VKILIAYSSLHGSAAECARWLEKTMDGAEAVNLKEQVVDPSSYDRVILGSSIYGGQIQKEVRDFCKRYLGILLQKQVGVYVTCLTREKAQIRQFLENGFPPELVERLAALCAPGGAIYFSKINFLERMFSKFLLNKYLKSLGMPPSDGKTDYVNLSKEIMNEFAKQMAGSGEKAEQ
jgi:menaquinone-dependent protoporphyrinogen oxidase